MSSSSKPDKKKDPSKTVLTIVVGFVVVYLSTKWNWAILVSLCVGLAGIASTWLSEKIDFLWGKLAWFLGLIVPNILLSLVFYLFLFPIAVLAGIFGEKDPLKLKNRNGSLFKTRTTEIEKASFEKPW